MVPFHHVQCCRRICNQLWQCAPVLPESARAAFGSSEYGGQKPSSSPPSAVPLPTNAKEIARCRNCLDDRISFAICPSAGILLWNCGLSCGCSVEATGPG